MGTRTYTRSDELNYIDYKTIKITSTKSNERKTTVNSLKEAYSTARDPGGSTTQAGSSKKPELYSPANVPAVFPIQTVRFFTRLLCAVAKTSPVVFVFFLLDF